VRLPPKPCTTVETYSLATSAEKNSVHELFVHTSYSTHIHTNNTEKETKQTIHRTTQKYIEQHKNWEEGWPCPVFAGFTLAFAFQLRKKHGKTSVTVAIHKLPVMCLITPGFLNYTSRTLTLILLMWNIG